MHHDCLPVCSDLPLGIIMIGVGDGPFDTMQEFDDALPQRRFVCPCLCKLIAVKARCLNSV